MNRKGLCSTCVQVAICIFRKESPVWQCEEFSNGNHQPVFRQAKVRRVIRQEATESE